MAQIRLLPKAALSALVLMGISRVGITGGMARIAKISKQIGQITQPVLGQISEAMGKITSQIQSPKELNKLLNKAVTPLLRDREALKGLDSFAKRAYAQRTRMSKFKLRHGTVAHSYR